MLVRSLIDGRRWLLEGLEGRQLRCERHCVFCCTGCLPGAVGLTVRPIDTFFAGAGTAGFDFLQEYGTGKGVEGAGQARDMIEEQWASPVVDVQAEHEHVLPDSHT